MEREHPIAINMSDLSKLPGIEDCLSNVLSYCTIEDLLACHKLSSSWKETLESRSLKKCWTSRLKKLVEDNEIILKTSRGRRYVYRIGMDMNVVLHDDGFDVEDFVSDSRQDWNRICYKFIEEGSIEDIIQLSTLLVASLKRVERPMNRDGPTEWMDPLHIAVLESDLMAVKILLPFIKVYGKYQGKTPFILACEQKEVKIVKAFLEIYEEKQCGRIFLDRDRDGKSGFMWLCYHGLTDLIRDITLPNADNRVVFPLPDHVTVSIDDPRGWDGSTPLMTATMRKHYSTVELLMQRGANVNAKDKSGKTAFTLAIWLADIDMINLYFKYAKEKNIDFNSTDETGRTAYIYACMMKLEEIVNMLREKAEDFGIDLLKKDIDGLMGSDFIEIRESQDEFDFPVELGTPQEWKRLTKNERRLRLYNRQLRGTQNRAPLFVPGHDPGYYQIDEDMPVQIQQYQEFAGGIQFIQVQAEHPVQGEDPDQMEQNPAPAIQEDHGFIEADEIVVPLADDDRDQGFEEADEIDFPPLDDDFHEFEDEEINFPAVDDPDQGFEEADEIDFPEGDNYPELMDQNPF